MAEKRPLVVGSNGDPVEISVSDNLPRDLLHISLELIANEWEGGGFTVTGDPDNMRTLVAYDDNSEAIGIHASIFGVSLLDDVDAAAARATLGMGTAATQNTGTSGANLPFANGNNTWGGTNGFQAVTVTTLVASSVIHSTSAGGITTRMFSSDGDTAGYIGTTTAHDFKIMRNGNFVGTFSASNFTATLGVLSSHATSGVGYAAGAGGTVTQLTSKSTGVTLNRACGQITMNNATLNAGASVTFTLTNSAIAASDHLSLTHAATGTLGNYELDYRCAAGSATIYVRNKTAGNLSEAVVIGFAVIKGVTS